jgi:hypothetical protein
MKSETYDEEPSARKFVEIPQRSAADVAEFLGTSRPDSALAPPG